MAKNLVIVESPAKAKTIEKFLGSDFKVASSFGHIADLPSKDLGVDVDGDFKPTKDGVAMPLDFENSKALFEGLVEILSLTEVKNILENHFKDILDKIYLT